MVQYFPSITGSLTVNGNLIISGSISTSGSITISGSVASASYAATLEGLGSASFAPAATFNVVSSSYAANSASLSTRLTTDESNFTSLSSSFATTSGSIAGRVTIIEGQDATTGSNNFTAPQQISDASNAISFTSTASLYTDGGLRVAKDSFVSGTAYFNNITVYGTSSIEYITSSQVNIGSNIITVNTDTPAVRFGGLSVFDSGSTQLTGSIFWDSEKNHWIYSNPSGSSYNSAMLMNGPRNTGSLGDEQGTLNNYVMKGQGGDHITSSQIIDDGTTVQIPGNLQVTGSTILASALTGSSAVFSGNVNLTGSATTIQLQGTSYGNIAADKDLYIDAGGSSAMYLRTNGGSTRLTITSAGRLDVAGEIRMTGSTLFRGMSSSTLQLCGGLSSSNVKIDGSIEVVTIDTNGATRLTIASTGNVGIGTTSPYSKLQITGGGIGAYQNTGGNPGAQIYLGDTNFDNASYYNSAPGIGSVYAPQTLVAGDLAFYVYASAAGSRSEVMRIIRTASGSSLGIGTSSPSALLHISGAGTGQMLRIQNTSTVSGDQGPLIQFVSANQVGGQGFESGYIQSIWTGEGNAFSMRFATKVTDGGQNERMRITSGGSVCINATSPGSNSPYLYNFNGDGSRFNAAFEVGVATPGFTSIAFRNPNGTVGSIAINENTVTYGGTSDYRLKEDLKDFSGLDKVSAIKVYDFKWKASEERNEGVLAHELMSVIPYAVNGEKDAVNEDDSIKAQMVDYSKLVPILVKAIQELKAEIDILKAQ